MLLAPASERIAAASNANALTVSKHVRIAVRRQMRGISCPRRRLIPQVAGGVRDVYQPPTDNYRTLDVYPTISTDG
jgi:hypothetical protein